MGHSSPLYPRQAASRATSFRLTDGGRDRVNFTVSIRAGWGQYGEYRTITNICWYDTAHPSPFREEKANFNGNRTKANKGSSVEVSLLASLRCACRVTVSCEIR